MCQLVLFKNYSLLSYDEFLLMSIEDNKYCLLEFRCSYEIQKGPLGKFTVFEAPKLCQEALTLDHSPVTLPLHLLMLKIGFDGGGTTTRAVVIQQGHDSLTVLGRGEAGSSNHYNVGPEGVLANCHTAMEIALDAADATQDKIAGYGFGLAGACSDAEQTLLREVLQPLCGEAPFVVAEDAPAAQSGAFAGGPGVIMIAGTGANCYGLNAAGEVGRADAWGPLLGDRGAGYRIGEAALRAICSAYDGAGPGTSLVEPCLRIIGVANFNELVQTVYKPEFTRDRIAALFPAVLEEAGGGDSVSKKLLEDAGHELAATAGAILKKLELQRIALFGGILENAPPVRAAFESRLRQNFAQLEIVAPRYDAAVGAALLLK